MPYAIDTTTPYDWDTASFAWGEFTAVKTWDTANIYSGTQTEAENLSATDAIRRTITLAKAEAISFVDAIAKSISLLKTEAIGGSDTYDSFDSFNLAFSESITFTDSLTKAITLVKGEDLSVTDAIQKHLLLQLADMFTAADGFSRVFSSQRIFAETLAIAEARKSTISKFFPEAVSFIETLRRHGPHVISDLLLLNEDISFEEFQDALGEVSPTLYGPFRTFITGDYDLSEALVRVTMSRENMAQDLRLTHFKVSADVPDVHESGVTNVVSTVASTHVTFVKSFLAPPEVTVTAATGPSALNPSVQNISNTGFDLSLTDAAGTRVVGTVYWKADGYGTTI